GVGTGGAQSAAAVTGQKAPGPYTPNGQVDGASGNVSLTMLDAMKFQPNTITGVKPGEKVTVNLQNSGDVGQPGPEGIGDVHRAEPAGHVPVLVQPARPRRSGHGRRGDRQLAVSGRPA